ncbi:MAG: WYL domain-containing protein, partial [Thermoleophilaceae bacterium]|nr:WYL domain-containing protein [Thermoleophilaceae bacterium]
LIAAAHSGEQLTRGSLMADLNVTNEELTEDIDVLNVVNFGGGSYVLFAQFDGDDVNVDTEPYSDNFARPARLLPLEAKALVAAIDVLGDYFPDDSLLSARSKVVQALGEDPAEVGLQIAAPRADDSDIATEVSRAIANHEVVELEHYKEDQDTFTTRSMEPYSLMNGREGWYVHGYDLSQNAPRAFRLDRVRSIRATGESFEPREGMEPELDGWARTGVLATSTVARIWIAPDRARWAKEDHEVVAELRDGSILIELPYGGTSWLITEIFKFAGDAVVLEPAEARTAVQRAARALLADVKSGTRTPPAAKPIASAKKTALKKPPSQESSEQNREPVGAR